MLRIPRTLRCLLVLLTAAMLLPTTACGLLGEFECFADNQCSNSCCRGFQCTECEPHHKTKQGTVDARTAADATLDDAECSHSAE